LIIDKLRLARGESFSVRVGQRIMAAAEVPAMRIALLCIETYKSGKNTNTRTVSEQWIPLLQNQRTQPGQVLEGTGTLHIPPSAPPSTPSGQGGLPRFDWKLRVVTEIADSPDYSADFPILVLGEAAGGTQI
jgi:hypothetical protein